MGTSIFTTLWDAAPRMHHAHLAEPCTAGSSARCRRSRNGWRAGLSPEQALATINRLIDQQAYTMAVTDLFLLSSLSDWPRRSATPYSVMTMSRRWRGMVTWP
jgi:DHA2 family multidrug resistance protein